MSRFLTTGINRSNITSADIYADGLTPQRSLDFLFVQSNLRVLFTRTEQIINSLGAGRMNLGQNINGDPLGTGPINLLNILNHGNNGITARYDLNKDLVNDRFFNSENVNINYQVQIFEIRLLKILFILKDLVPQFMSDVLDARENKFSSSQALNLAFNKSMEIFKIRMQSQNLINPPILAKIKLVQVYKNKQLAENIYNTLTFNFE